MLTTIQDLKICEDVSDKGKESSKINTKRQDLKGWKLIQNKDLGTTEKEFSDPSIHASEEDRKILKISPSKNTMQLLRSKSDSKDLLLFEKDK